MDSKGIRIKDRKKDGAILVKLSDILKIIDDGHSFFWAILFSDVVFIREVSNFIVELQNKIEKSKNGLILTWYELELFSGQIHQEIDLTVIGCKNKELLHRYEREQEMYETCDISIKMFDSSYWEVFSRNIELIQRLAKKFKDIKFIASDFER